MANGFWNFLKKVQNIKKETKDENNLNYINNNPTEEQLKDNKHGNVAIILSLISCILLILFIALIVAIFSNNLGLGILSIFLLIIPSSMQIKAIKKAKKQLNINGKGKIKFLCVKYIFPTISAIISIILLFYLIGFYLK